MALSKLNWCTLPNLVGVVFLLKEIIAIPIGTGEDR
jgi:hypothetical protein